MRVLGIDPGTSKVGWGVVDEKERQLYLVAYGQIRTSSALSFPEKLGKISQEVVKVILEHKPEALAIEEPFIARNPKIALRVGEVVGAIMLSALDKGLEVASYSVLEIKQAVVGYGRADKEQVQNMVKVLLHLDAIPKSYDAADAIAAAICHQHSRGRIIDIRCKRSANAVPRSRARL